MTLTNIILIAVIVALLVIVIAAVSAMRYRRSSRLRQQFGPEYQRAVDDRGRGKGESELRQREKQHEQLDLHPLPAEARSRYHEEWHDIQHHFVDVPGKSVHDADQLATRVMRDIGYPVDDFDRRAAGLSVDHPGVMSEYRSAHAIAQRHERGEAGTDDLRRALTGYRSVLDELLEDSGTSR